MDEAEEHHHRQIEVSPFLVGLLGILAGTLLVATFHCILVCWRTSGVPSRSQRTTLPTTNNGGAQTTSNNTVVTSRRSSPCPSSSRAHQQQIIITSTFAAWKKDSDAGDDDVCAVCLSEFKDGDVVRILTQCAHTYHVPCIDKWLASHSNCPLCRADTSSSSHPCCVPEHLSSRFPDFGC